MNKEEFEKAHKELDEELKAGHCGSTDYFIATVELQYQYIDYLEMYLKNVQNQCIAQDKVIKLAEEKLGAGYWQKVDNE